MIALVGVLFAVWLLLWGIRIEIVQRHIGKRIEEIYSSTEWFRYDIDMTDAYWRTVWDYRKWSYRSFFPEEVV